ncbi:MAG: enoyl-CoA hydratase/isomerase family protein [Nocardioidaceae bacterium]
MPPNVQTAESSGIVTLALTRPDRLNAVNAALVGELVAALDGVDARARAVVLVGEGRAFCSGHDLKEDLSDETAVSAERRLEQLQDVTRRIRALDVPVVAAVHGYAIGAGAELALCCDLILAATGTTFRFPEVSLGLSVTNAATRLLPALIGPVRAKQLVLLGDAFDAETAHRMGLINEVVPPADLRPTAMEWAARLANQPTRSLTLAKRALNEGTDGTVASALRLEIDQALATTGSEETA